MRALPAAAALVLIAGVHADPALGQGPPARGRFAAELSTTAILFPTPTVADFDTGWVEYPGMVISV
ncbi:MAG: hypothetical protein ACOCUW_00660, partial [Gemmatimonadota bacterium]